MREFLFLSLFVDQFYFPLEYYSCSVDEDERRVGETCPRRVSRRRETEAENRLCLSSQKHFLSSRGLNSRLKKFFTR